MTESIARSTLSDEAVIAFLEVLALDGAERRLGLLGLPRSIASSRDTARSGLDAYQSAASDDQASIAVQQAFGDIERDHSSDHTTDLRTAAARLASTLTDEEVALLLWVVTFNNAIRGGHAIPAQLDRHAIVALTSIGDNPDAMGGAAEADPWGTAYRARKPDVDPDLLVNELGAIDAVRRLFATVRDVGDRRSILAWGRGMTEHSASIEPAMLSSPWGPYVRLGE